ncbi:MAG: cytochrome c biogenesis protein ResB [Candidatus Latescibacterota bacterium]|nr:MAG: cytochrome c biogenesis protein ResB [Candidatus Latescibacterota bacterium]
MIENKWVKALRALGSIKLTLILLGLFAVSIATATFLEVRYGLEGAKALVYNARWFEVLLGLLVLNLTISLVTNWPFRRHQIGFLITHIGFIVVLVGGAITRFWGYEGSMPIREGQSTNYMYSMKEYVRVALEDESTMFPVRLYKPGANSTRRSVTLGSESFEVSVVEYWPNMGMRLVEGPGGEPAVVFKSSALPQDHQHQILRTTDTHNTAGVRVHLLDAAPDSVSPTSRFGDLDVTIGGETHTLPVPADPPAEMRVGGYRFRITEFAPRFQVGRTPLPTDEMTNPAIRVEVGPPDGDTYERLLFAFHPEFDMGHAGGEAKVRPLDMTYRYARSIYLFPDGDGLKGRADFPVSIRSGHESDPGEPVKTGERFAVSAGTILQSGEFSFLVLEHWRSAIEEPYQSDDENKRAAARIVVEDASGRRGEALVVKWDESVPVDVGGREVQLAFGPIQIEVPYRIHLDDFVLSMYPGSNNPASFESKVRVYDEERGVDGEEARIYMNHPLTYRGFKHFQSSYDRDQKGTVLSVNRDPGKQPTYFGYFLVGFGFIVTITRGLLWYRKPVVAKRGA